MAIDTCARPVGHWAFVLSSRIAAILAVSLFAFRAKRARSTMADGAVWRAQLLYFAENK